jgi:dTDP-4-amino-4,6-dideoxygalactose transaminase
MTDTPFIPLNDLQRHTASISAELHAAADRVMARGYYVMGPEVEAFEHEFAAYCGTAECVALANGTDALELALRALGVGPGDTVATVANAGGYSTTAIRAIGALPLYVEIGWASMNMDPQALAAALTPKVKAVIATHLYGLMADMESLLAAAGRLGIPVVEDCAQAQGAEQGGKRAGSWGAIGCYSFYPTKNLGALGDGGAVVTDDPALARTIRQLRQYGWNSKYVSTVAGGRNSRLDEMQAAFLRTKLSHLDGWNARRRAVAVAYNAGLAGLDLRWPSRLGADCVAHLYVVRSQQRAALQAALKAASIGTDIHYPVPDHLQESGRDLGYKPAQLPLTEAACDQVLTLPCFPELRSDEIERVVAAVTAALKSARAHSHP